MDNTNQANISPAPKWMEDMANGYRTIPKRIKFWLIFIAVFILLFTIGISITLNIETSNIRNSTNSSL